MLEMSSSGRDWPAREVVGRCGIRVEDLNEIHARKCVTEDSPNAALEADAYRGTQAPTPNSVTWYVYSQEVLEG